MDPTPIAGLAFVLILAANLLVFLRREWESNHRAADYSRINIPSDVPTLTDWRIRGDRFFPRISWNKRPSLWQVIRNGEVTETVPGNAPFLTLDPPRFNGQPGAALADFRQTFTLRPLPAGMGPDITFGLTPIAKEFYHDRGMFFPKDLYQVRSDLPAGRFTRHSVADWTDDYRYVDRSALAEADRLIHDKIGIKDEDPELVRMEKIIHFLRSRLVDAGGVPKEAFRWMDPFRIFSEMVAGTGNGWCTQNAQIFAFFANRAGLPTRFVYCGTVQKNQFVYDGHSWTESFLREQNRWVYTDPQKAIVGVFDRDGHALNTADVFQLCQYGAFEGVTARTFKQWHWKNLPVEAPPDTAIDVPFALVNETARKQFTPHSIIKYRRPPNVEDIRYRYGMFLCDWTFTWTNFRRYLWYSDLAYSNRPTRGSAVYRLRQSLFGALVASGIILILSLS